MLLEQGSDLALELWGSSRQAASSVLAYPEGRAALAAARRGNRLTSRLYRESTERFEEIYLELIAVGVDERLTRSAGAMAADLELRGYDAVHLATAMDLAVDGVALVSWDRDLSRAALQVGLPVIGE